MRIRHRTTVTAPNHLTGSETWQHRPMRSLLLPTASDPSKTSRRQVPCKRRPDLGAILVARILPSALNWIIGGLVEHWLSAGSDQ